MSRTLSAAAKAAIHAPESADGFLYLLTITHASLGSPLRYVRNNENVTSRGNVYTAYPFDVAIADEHDDKPPEVELIIDNVSREPLGTLRGLATPPTITLEVVAITTPDTVEISCPNLTLRNVTSDAFSMRGTLSFESVLQEPYPGYTFNPVDFPAAF